MKAENSKFAIGDKVFAKIRGFPHWPAIITDIENDSKQKILKYKVIFYLCDSRSRTC